jgi:hypothetical protein
VIVVGKVYGRSVDTADSLCAFCGYEPTDPDGIYSEVFEAYVCTDCEAVAVRVLTTVAEAGGFRLGHARFEVIPSPGDDAGLSLPPPTL